MFSNSLKQKSDEQSYYDSILFWNYLIMQLYYIPSGYVQITSNIKFFSFGFLFSPKDVPMRVNACKIFFWKLDILDEDNFFF